jgi:hypothetical protein
MLGGCFLIAHFNGIIQTHIESFADKKGICFISSQQATDFQFHMVTSFNHPCFPITTILFSMTLEIFIQ